MTLDIVTVGDSIIDIIVPVSRFPNRNEDTVLGMGIKKQLGGAANFLLQARRLGATVGIIDSVGNDDLGLHYIDTLKREGVDVSRVFVRDDLPTSCCIVLVDRKGNHVYIGIHGAGWHLLPEEVDPNFIRDSKILYVSGYTLHGTPLRDSVLKAVDIAYSSGMPIFFDPSPAASDIPKEILQKVLSLSYGVLLNDREAKILTGSGNIREAARKILSCGPKIVIIKRGAKGCVAVGDNLYEKVSAFSVEVVDTTGAGDVFNATFIYGFLQKWPLKEALTFANVVAAIKVTKLGAGTEVPTRAEINNFLRKRNVPINISHDEVI